MAISISMQQEQIEALSRATGRPLIQALVQLSVRYYEQYHTMLAVCPNSEAVARAALLAGQACNAPVIFAATLNQIDLDGGYTGWTPATFMDWIRHQKDMLDIHVPVLVGLDHGGAWQKDSHRQRSYDYKETLSRTKQSIEACIAAGYAHLHIDTTADITRPAGKPLPVNIAVDRTLELLAFAEATRRKLNKPLLSYEVSIEPEGRQACDIDRLSIFLEQLYAGIRELGLDDAQPCMYVAQLGSHLDNTYFDSELAVRINEALSPFNAALKGHHTDYGENIEDYPLTGMAGGNIGPELTEEECRALVDLVALESKLDVQPSGLLEKMRAAVLEDGGWCKWLTPSEAGLDMSALPAERQQWLIATACRYIWAHPEVLSARKQLYENLRNYRNADAFVVSRIKQSLIEYHHAFNLINFNDQIVAGLAMI